MDLAFQESLPVAKKINLGVTSLYFKQKSIGNRRGADKLGEAIKALQVYLAILEYYYYQETNSELSIDETDIKQVYNKFKQVYYAVKPSPYGHS